MVERWASVMGVAPEKVVIKSNRSSLGSCTPKKTLNFSYRIIMAPPEIVEYVVVHELAHLIHMNHSRSYWTTVCRYLADAKARKRWLREHARRLTL
jgi:predicted metal-dependent hydrolase